ncbi:helix-turn-helix domain-containing protein [Nonomuraea indica]|uniref:Helix-turn-helix domain-containing protein n=1 Tax=Nonomuraea indica TaxID=1581193 RepID=A0ABW8AFM1_9ACTN
MTAEQIRHARDLLTRPENTVSSIARLLGVSRSTIYTYVPELATGPAVGQPTVRAELEAGS